MPPLGLLGSQGPRVPGGIVNEGHINSRRPEMLSYLSVAILNSQHYQKTF